MEVHDYYPPNTANRNLVGGSVWLGLILVFVPLIAVLVIIGLVYEQVIRIDRSRRLPSAVHWVLASTLGILLVVMLVLGVYRWLTEPSA